MVQNVLMGIGAGAASAMLLASALGRSSAVPLVIFTGLPLLIAAIGWSHRAALLGVAVMCAILAIMFQNIPVTLTVATALTFGLPAWWLGYLALLARPNEATGGIDWYPVGNLVVWCALLSAATIAFTIPFIGFDEASVQATMRATFEQVFRLRSGTPADQPLTIPDVSDPAALIERLVVTFLPVATVIGAMVNLFNLWLAGIVTRVSGRLHRPWPNITAMRFPTYALVIGAVSLALWFIPGADIVGLIAGIFATATLFGYAVLGLAVMHTVTRGMKNRGLILGIFYAGLAMLCFRGLVSFGQGWPVVIVILIGLADALFNLRARLAAWRGLPPPAHT
jgi:hypothetical protein